MGPLKDPGQIRIVDASGKRLECPGCGLGTEEYPFVCEFSRNNLENTNEYTLEVYDIDNKLLKEIPITLENDK